MFAVDFKNAIRENDVNVAWKIIESVGRSPLSFYKSMLDETIKCGCKEIVHLLLDKGKYNVNERNANGGTPLHSAVVQLSHSMSWSGIVIKLLRNGASVELKDNDGNTPIHLAFLNDAPGEVIDVLLDHYMKPYCGETKNGKKGYPVIVLKKEMTLNNDGLGLYHIACTRPCLNILKTMVVHGLADRNDRVPLNSKSSFAEYSSLHFAVLRRQHAVVKVLLSARTNVNMTDNNGSTALHLALQGGDRELIELLLPSYKACRDTVNKLGHTHFMAACTGSNKDLVKEYLREIYIKFPHTSSAWIGKQVKPFSILPFAGYSALHFAVAIRKYEVVQILLDYGVDFQTRDLNGSTPLHLALYIRNKSMAQLMLLKDVFRQNIVDGYGTSHFMAACAAGELVEDVIDAKVKADSPSYAGYRPIHFAAAFGNYEVVKFLIVNGARLYVQDANGSSPLHLALENKHIMVIDSILAWDGFVSPMVNNSGLTHFMAACAGSEVAIVEECLQESQREASSSSITSLIDAKVNNDGQHWFSGYSPLQFAVAFQRQHTVQLLQNYSTY